MTNPTGNIQIDIGITLAAGKIDTNPLTKSLEAAFSKIRESMQKGDIGAAKLDIKALKDQLKQYGIAAEKAFKEEASRLQAAQDLLHNLKGKPGKLTQSDVTKALQTDNEGKKLRSKAFAQELAAELDLKGKTMREATIKLAKLAAENEGKLAQLTQGREAFNSFKGSQLGPLISGLMGEVKELEAANELMAKATAHTQQNLNNAHKVISQVDRENYLLHGAPQTQGVQPEKSRGSVAGSYEKKLQVGIAKLHQDIGKGEEYNLDTTHARSELSKLRMELAEAQGVVHQVANTFQTAAGAATEEAKAISMLTGKLKAMSVEANALKVVNISGAENTDLSKLEKELALLKEMQAIRQALGKPSSLTDSRRLDVVSNQVTNRRDFAQAEADAAKVAKKAAADAAKPVKEDKPVKTELTQQDKFRVKAVREYADAEYGAKAASAVAQQKPRSIQWIEEETKALDNLIKKRIAFGKFIKDDNGPAEINKLKARVEGNNTWVAEEKARIQRAGTLPGLLEQKSKAEDDRARAQTRREELGAGAYPKERLASIKAEQDALQRLLQIQKDLKEVEREHNNRQQVRYAALEDKTGITKPALFDTKTHDAGIANTRKEIQALEQELHGLDTLWNKVYQSMGLFLRYAVLYQIFYSLSNAISNTVKEVLDLQTALVGIKAVTSATTTEMADVTAAVESVATSTAFTVDEIAKGGQILVQAGVPIKDFGRTLKATADLASSTGSDFKTAADLMTTFKTVYKDLDEGLIADKLRNAVNASKLDLHGLSTISNYILQTSKATGISLDSLLAASAALKNAGIKDSTIGTGLRQAALEVFSPDEKSLKGLQARYAAIGQNLSKETIKGLFQKFKQAKDPWLAALNELEKLGFGGVGDDALSRVFDVRATNVLRALQAEKGSYLQLKSAMGETGGAAKGAKTQLESFQNASQNLAETISALAFSMSNGFIRSLTEMVTKGTRLVDNFRETVNARREATGETGAGGAILGGAGAFVASAAGKASIGVSLLRGGLLTVITETIKLYTKGTGALETFIKVIQDAAIAMGAIAILKSIVSGTGGLAGALGIGAAVAGAKAAPGAIKGLWQAAGTASTTAKAGGLIGVAAGVPATFGAAAEAGAGAEAAIGLAAGGILGFFKKIANFAKLVISGHPVGVAILAVTAAYEALDHFTDLFTNVADKAEEKAAAHAENSQAIIKRRTQLSTDIAASKESVEHLGEFRDSINNSAEAVKKYASPETEAAITKIFEEASNETLAVGTESLRKLVEKVTKITGKPVDTNALISDAQKTRDTINLAEGRRDTRKVQYREALSRLSENPEDTGAKALVDAYESMSAELRLIMDSHVTGLAEAKAVFASEVNEGDGSRYAKLIKANEEERKKLEDEQLKGAEQFAKIIASSTDVGRISHAQVKLKQYMEEAIANGQTSLAQGIAALIKESMASAAKQMKDHPLKGVSFGGLLNQFFGAKPEAKTEAKPLFTKEGLDEKVEAARRNELAIQQEPLKKKISKYSNEAEVAPTAKPSLEEYAKPVDADTITRSNEVIAAEREKLEADKHSKLGALQDLGKKQQESRAQKLEPEQLAAQDKEYAAAEQEYLKAKDAAAKVAAEQANIDKKILEVKRRFLPEENKIKELQTRLKTAESAKLQNVELQLSLLKEIHDAEQGELKAEIEAARAVVASMAKFSGAEKLTPEQLLKGFENDRGRADLQDSKDLAKAYDVLAKAVYENANLEEKYATQTDTARRKVLDKRLKSLSAASTKADTHVQTLENRLQASTDKLANARESLAESYRMAAEHEERFQAMLREIEAKPIKASDVRQQIATAKDAHSTKDLVKAAEEAKSGYDAGVIGKREAKQLIEEAQAAVKELDTADINAEQQHIQFLAASNAELTHELQAARVDAEATRSSLDAVKESLDALDATIAANQSKQSSAQAPVSVMTPEQQADKPSAASTANSDELSTPVVSATEGEHHAEGGYITGPGTGTSDEIPAMLSNGEFVVSAKGVKSAGLSLLEEINSGKVKKFAAGGPTSAQMYYRHRAEPLGGEGQGAAHWDDLAKKLETVSEAIVTLTKAMEENSKAIEKPQWSAEHGQQIKDYAATAKEIPLESGGYDRETNTVHNDAGNPDDYAHRSYAMEEANREVPTQLASSADMAFKKDSSSNVPNGFNNPGLGGADSAPTYYAGDAEPGYATGGMIDGAGTGTSDSVPIKASKGEFMEPAAAVSRYGADFMDKVRNLQIDPSLAKSVVAPAAPSLGKADPGTKQVEKQPVLFNVGGAIIRADANPDAVAQFTGALRTQAAKQGRRI